MASSASTEHLPTAGGQGIFVAALNALSVHVAVLDQDGRIVAVNDAWRRFAVENGATDPAALAEGADYLGASCGGGDADGAAAAAGVRSVLAGDADEFRLEYPCHSPTELRWFELRVTPLTHAGLRGAVVAHSVITERKLAEQRLVYLAHHDELTGLANRRRMTDTLTAAQPSGRLGLLLLDVDRFKTVNDTYGHAAGNEVLQAVAEALARPLGAGALAGRYGGDEFCVALFDCSADILRLAAHDATARTREHLARLPCARGTSVSVGATLVAPHEPLSAAMRRADEALYAVKREGRDDFRVA